MNSAQLVNEPEQLLTFRDLRPFVRVTTELSVDEMPYLSETVWPGPASAVSVAVRRLKPVGRQFVARCRRYRLGWSTGISGRPASRWWLAVGGSRPAYRLLSVAYTSYDRLIVNGRPDSVLLRQLNAAAALIPVD